MRGASQKRAARRLFVFGLLLATCHLAQALGMQAADPSPDMPAAVEIYQLPLAPTDRDLIEAALKAGDYSGAETALLRASADHPKIPLFYSALGRVFFLDHKYLNTAIAMKKAEALQPLTPQDRFTLAMAYISMGRGEWARPELEKLAQSNPHNSIYPYWQGRLDYNRQDVQAAAVHFRLAIALDADFARAHDNLGLCLEQMGQSDEALQQYRQAVLLNRQQSRHSAWPSLDLGSLLLQENHLDEAQAALEEALAFDSESELTHIQLGVLHEKRNDFARAMEELSRAAKLDPADPQPHFLLARVYKHAGDTQQEQRELKLFQGLQPKTRQARLD